MFVCIRELRYQQNSQSFQRELIVDMQHVKSKSRYMYILEMQFPFYNQPNKLFAWDYNVVYLRTSLFKLSTKPHYAVHMYMA